MLLVVLVTLGLGVGGCSGTAEPSAQTTGPSVSSGSASPSAEPTPSSSQTTAAPTTDPNVPAAARANTPEGAQEFTKYFIAQLNKSWQTPNPNLLPPLSASECTTCSAVTETAQEYANLGQRYEGLPVAEKAVVVQSFSEVEGAVVLVFGEQEAARVVDAYGATIRSVQPAKANLALTLNHANGWRVTKGQALGTPS